MRIVWTRGGWADYCEWQTEDRKTLKRINQLIEDTQRHPYEGIGKPEPLKYGAEGAWSRRITKEQRLVYLVEGEDLVILQAKYHY